MLSPVGLATAKLKHGLISMIALGVAYSLFCLMLSLDGHRPSRVTLPIAPAHYYLFEAIVLLPWFLVLWLIFGAVSSRVAGGPLRETLAVVGVGYGLPILLGFVLPDIAAYLIVGFDRLPSFMPYYAPLAVLGVLVLTTLGLRAKLKLSLPRAMAATLIGFMVQGAIGGVLIR